MQPRPRPRQWRRVSDSTPWTSMRRQQLQQQCQGWRHYASQKNPTSHSDPFLSLCTHELLLPSPTPLFLSLQRPAPTTSQPTSPNLWKASGERATFILAADEYLQSGQESHLWSSKCWRWCLDQTELQDQNASISRATLSGQISDGSASTAVSVVYKG